MAELVKLPPAFPLCWPDDWPRTEPRIRGLVPSSARAAGGTGNFRTTAGRAYDLLAHELDNWTTVAFRPNQTPSRRLFVVTTNVVSRLAGKPVSEGRSTRNDDPGVAVWWIVQSVAGRSLRVVACDTWSSVAQNLRACGVVVESLRAMERAGASQAMARTEAGFVPIGLPAPRAWWRELLDLPESFTAAEVERAYKKAALRAHPDQGGSDEAFIELSRARETALRYASAPSASECRP
jgi:hypothetical protein